MSESTARKVVGIQGVRPDRVHLVHNVLDAAIESRAFSRRDLWPLGDGTRLLTVARLTSPDRYKGIDTVIRAIPRITEAVPRMSYTVVGEGDDRRRLERLAEEVGVANHVIFTGRLSKEELMECYRACDVFVMVSPKEGFGIVYLEAMGFARPVVAAKSGGACEVVVDEETGLLVDSGDEDAIADAIIRLLGDPDLRVRLGRAARGRVAEHFLFGRLERRLEELLLSRAAT